MIEYTTLNFSAQNITMNNINNWVMVYFYNGYCTQLPPAKKYYKNGNRHHVLLGGAFIYKGLQWYFKDYLSFGS